jgi:hypothetical protein
MQRNADAKREFLDDAKEGASFGKVLMVWESLEKKHGGLDDSEQFPTEDEINEVERPVNHDMISKVEGAPEEESFDPSNTCRQQVVPSLLPVSFSDALIIWSCTDPDLDEGMINRFRT